MHSQHRKVISTIDALTGRERGVVQLSPFAAWEVIKLTSLSRPTIYRVLRRLKGLKFLTHNNRPAYHHQQWTLSSKWDVEKVIEAYEFVYDLKREEVS